MTFEEWWTDNQHMMPSIVKIDAREAWIAATKAERDACVDAIKAISDSHCADTGECGQGCDFVTAWETAIDELQNRRCDRFCDAVGLNVPNCD